MVSFRPGPPSELFLKLPDFILKKVVQPAADKGAQKGTQVAQQNARVDKGTMRDNTHFEVEISGSNVQIHGYNDTDYWQYHEWGTVYISAKPFMEPGMKAAQEETLNQIESNFKGLKF